MSHSLSVCVSAGSKVKIQPAGPILFSVVPLRNVNSHSLLGHSPRLVPPDGRSLNQLGPMQRYPVHFLNVKFILGSVAAIFPASIPQGAQGSQALWRSQQTADRKKQTDT